MNKGRFDGNAPTFRRDRGSPRPRDKSPHDAFSHEWISQWQHMGRTKRMQRADSARAHADFLHIENVGAIMTKERAKQGNNKTEAARSSSARSSDEEASTSFTRQHWAYRHWQSGGSRWRREGSERRRRERRRGAARPRAARAAEAEAEAEALRASARRAPKLTGAAELRRRIPPLPAAVEGAAARLSPRARRRARRAARRRAAAKASPRYHPPRRRSGS
jgi:hypothetical protein